MVRPPNEYQHFKKRSDKFRAWLSERGAQVLEPTNEWEVLRYKTDSGTSIIYTNKKGTLRFTGDSLVAWEAYRIGAPYRAGPVTPRINKGSPVLQALRKRDGDKCFYCMQEVSEEDESIEHFVSRTHGGPDHIANMVLAHIPCNALAGALSVMEKIKMRESVLLKATDTSPPWEVDDATA